MLIIVNFRKGELFVKLFLVEYIENGILKNKLVKALNFNQAEKLVKTNGY